MPDVKQETMLEKVEKQALERKPPRPEDYLSINLPVLLWPKGDLTMEPHVGFVTKINSSGTVQVIKFAPGWKDGRTFDGCRHVSDPKATDPVLMDGTAAWEHTDLNRFLFEVYGHDVNDYYKGLRKKGGK